MRLAYNNIEGKEDTYDIPLPQYEVTGEEDDQPGQASDNQKEGESEIYYVPLPSYELGEEDEYQPGQALDDQKEGEIYNPPLPQYEPIADIEYHPPQYEPVDDSIEGENYYVTSLHNVQRTELQEIKTLFNQAITKVTNLFHLSNKVNKVWSYNVEISNINQDFSKLDVDEQIALLTKNVNMLAQYHNLTQTNIAIAFNHTSTSLMSILKPVTQKYTHNHSKLDQSLKSAYQDNANESKLDSYRNQSIKELDQKLTNIYLSAEQFMCGINRELPHAVKNHDLAAANLLLQFGANPSASNVFNIAYAGGNIEMMKLLANNHADMNQPLNNNKTPLVDAISNQDNEMIKFLLDLGATPSSSALSYAVNADNTYACNLLFQYGANLPWWQSSYTPGLIHIAAEHGNTDIAKLLLNHGADKDSVVYEWQGYLYTFWNGIKSLFGYGDPIQGKTPLHYAAMNQHPEMVNFLLSQGANPNIHDSQDHAYNDYLHTPTNVYPVLPHYEPVEFIGAGSLAEMHQRTVNGW
jgi:ankyrin repeat protein